MKSEPGISQDTIRQWLDTWWSIEAVEVNFLPKGECSWGYIVRDRRSKWWFLKLTQDTLCSDCLREENLRASVSLYVNCGIKNISIPEITDEFELIARPDNYRAILMPFINGIPAYETEFLPEQQYLLGQLIARIHQAKPHLDSYPLREIFARKDFRPILHRMNEKGDPNLAQEKLIELLQSVKRPILELFEEFDETRSRVITQTALAGEFVICHGDPSSGNVMLRDDGEVMLIDWDTCIYAPKERDLFFLTNSPEALEGYHSIVGDFSLNRDVMSFYQLQWDTQEILDFSSRILSTNQSNRQNQHDLSKLYNHLKESGLLR